MVENGSRASSSADRLAELVHKHDHRGRIDVLADLLQPGSQEAKQLRALVFVFSVEHVGQRIDRDDVGHLSIEGRALRERHTAPDDISQFLLNGRNNSWISKLDSSTRVQEPRLADPTPQVRPPSRSSDTSGLSVVLRWGRFLAFRNEGSPEQKEMLLPIKRQTRRQSRNQESRQCSHRVTSAAWSSSG